MVDDFSRLIGGSVLQDLERDVYRGLQMQVRVMRFERFPTGCLPIRLDWRSAWQPEAWTEFAGSAEAADAEKEAAIVACFGDESPPLSIVYTDCNGTQSSLDPGDLKLLNSESGDQVLLASDCHWPCICPGSCPSHYVELKYLVGFRSADALQQMEPMIVANIAAMFNYRFENPETMGGSSSSTYKLLTQYFQKNLGWR